MNSKVVFFILGIEFARVNLQTSVLSSEGWMAGWGNSSVPPAWGNNLCRQGSCPEEEKNLELWEELVLWNLIMN
jgi:hypothetical protein